jgi:hypothetical protein
LKLSNTSNPTISTDEIPQADTLESVIATVEAVSQGKRSFQEIAQHIGLQGRQGRYYRQAAEILGLIKKTSNKNVSALTPIGQTFLASTVKKREQILINQVLDAKVFQSVIGMMAASNGVSNRADLERSLSTLVLPTTEGMIDRRLSTILSWLETLNLIEREDNRVILKTIPSSINKLEISDVSIPVLPKPTDLKLFTEVNQRKIGASELIKFEVDRAKFDRANSEHERLRSLLADKIKACGEFPTWNKYVDLAVNMNGQDYIIEVKTSQHVRSQVRRGISQLYEYRYLQARPKANLILMLEKPLSGANAWMLEYVTKDRGINVIWDDHDNELFSTPEGAANIPFLS